MGVRNEELIICSSRNIMKQSDQEECDEHVAFMG